MDLEDPSTQLMFTTAPIEAHVDGSEDEVGTAFFYEVQTEEEGKTIPLMLTNRHVIEDCNRATVHLNLADAEGNPSGNTLAVRIPGNRLHTFGTEELDILAFPIGDILNEVANQGQNIVFRSVSTEIVPDQDRLTDLSAIEDITFIGYPSGLMDTANSMPVTRRGITATAVWNDYENDPAFLIDAGVYPGSSGSPVFIFNRGSYTGADGNLVAGTRLIFLGVLSQTMIHEESSFSKAYLGLGKVIRADAVSSYLTEVSEEVISLA